MARLARDVMTPNPVCASGSTTIDRVAQLMVDNDCGEIPIVDGSNQLIGVITDRDIVCRVVARGIDPTQHRVAEFMTRPVVTVRPDTQLSEALWTMETNRIRRVPVTDGNGTCAGIIAQADVAQQGGEHDVAQLVRKVSRSPDGRADVRS